MSNILVEFSFFDGRVLLVDPQSVHGLDERAKAQRDNRRWIERLSAIYEAHAARVEDPRR